MSSNIPLVGDRVLIRATCYRSGYEGVLTDIDNSAIYSHTVRFPDREEQTYKANELERIDASSQVDGAGSVAMPAGVAGSPEDDPSGAGTTAEPEAEKRTLYLTGEGATEAIAALTDRVDRLFRGAKLQDFINDRLRSRLDSQHSDIELIGKAVALLARSEQSTTRRMRINITKNTKGYNHDVTFEITSTDPACDLDQEMADGLRLADRLARQAITEAEYTDAEGVPGEDDKPF